MKKTKYRFTQEEKGNYLIEIRRANNRAERRRFKKERLYIENLLIRVELRFKEQLNHDHYNLLYLYYNNQFKSTCKWLVANNKVFCHLLNFEYFENHYKPVEG